MIEHELAPIDAPELLALGVDIHAGSEAVRARLLTDAQLRARSHGEIQKPETLNYRTNKPERGGLFCARVFGPIEDDTCICGKYAGDKYRGVTCEKCGVEILPTAVRAQRFGHIELAAPVVHPLCKSAVARLLQLTSVQLDNVLDGQASLDASGNLQAQVDATEIGGRALREILAGFDAEAMDGDIELAPLGRYLAPVQLMVEVLLVLPAGLRPIETLNKHHVALGDLNELYRRVINRNNRLRRLIELNAPLIILHNEYRHLREAIEQLFDNEHTAAPLEYRGRIMRSLGTLADERLRELHARAKLPGESPAFATILSAGAAGVPVRAIVREDVRDDDEPDYDF